MKIDIVYEDVDGPEDVSAPEPDGEQEPTGASEPEGASEPTGASEPEGASEPTGAPEPEGTPEPEPSAAPAQPVGAPEPEPTGTPEPEPLGYFKRPLYRATRESRARRGLKQRESIPLEALASWRPAADRPDPADWLLRDQERGLELGQYTREALDWCREAMADDPSSYFCGARSVMDRDLRDAPSTGLKVTACADAEIGNFCFFRGIDGRLALEMDVPGGAEPRSIPWEWDVKRLATSVELLGRELGLGGRGLAKAVRASVRGYREEMLALAAMGDAAAWYAPPDCGDLADKLGPALLGGPDEDELMLGDEGEGELGLEAELGCELGRDGAGSGASAAAGAAADGPAPTAAPAAAGAAADGPRSWLSPAPKAGQDADPALDADPADTPAGRLVQRVLEGHLASLSPAACKVLGRYWLADVCDLGAAAGAADGSLASDGSPAPGAVAEGPWLAVLQGVDEDDVLVLRIDQLRHLELHGADTPGTAALRTAHALRATRASEDPFLGWTTLRRPEGDSAGRAFVVRTAREEEREVDLGALDAGQLKALARCCGRVLAHAHARTGDRIAIAAYLGGSKAFDKAVARFAEKYADQVEQDFARYLDAFEAGEL